MNALTREPLAVRAAITAVITAVIHLLVLFGLPIPDSVEDGIAAAVDAVGLLVAVLWSRGAVTPVADPRVTPDAATAEITDPADVH